MPRRFGLKLKYSVEFLGFYDYYGEPKCHYRYIEWANQNCKGKWRYYSPDAKMPPYYERKPDDWPMFYAIIFYFAYKKDYEKFREKFM